MVASAYNDKKDLRKGERMMVTLDQILHDTLLVVLDYRGMKFAGVLLNTSKRRGPFGIEPEIDGVKVSEMKDDSKNKETKSKEFPFPQPLDTRLSYNLKANQPPVRNYFKRKRRSRRKVKMDMHTIQGRKLLSHNSNCHCDLCESSKGGCAIAKERKSKRKSSVPVKEIQEEVIETQTKIDIQNCSMPTNEVQNQVLEINNQNVDGNTAQNVIAALSREGEIKRSPVIKISFKSPGGQGQVLKIPSKMHIASSDDQKLKLSMYSNSIQSSYATPQARARRVLKKAKFDHYRFLHDDKKIVKKNLKKKNHKNIKRANDQKMISQEAKVVLKQLNKNDAVYQQNINETSPKKDKLITPNKLSNNGEVASDNDSLEMKSPQTHTIKVTRCKTYKGFTVCQGDIVWGKIVGFPWWPGQVKYISCKKVDGDVLQQEACVDWFQSKTVSHLQAHTLEHFSKYFHKRFEKRRKSIKYRRAIKMAQDAEKELTPEVRSLISQFET